MRSTWVNKLTRPLEEEASSVTLLFSVSTAAAAAAAAAAQTRSCLGCSRRWTSRCCTAWAITPLSAMNILLLTLAAVWCTQGAGRADAALSRRTQVQHGL
eukprot:142691-Pelagomonas_calceolata.AAC.4